MGVQIGRVNAAMHGTVSRRRSLFRGEHPRGLIAVGEFHCGAVEFVANCAFARGTDGRVCDGHGVAIAQREVIGEPGRSIR